MKLLYAVLDTCQNDNDLAPIQKVLQIGRRIYKRIQLPDDEEEKRISNSFSGDDEKHKIALVFGLQGHPLFSN